MKLSAGKFDQLVTVQQRALEQDALGANVAPWSDLLVDVWARVEPIRGREYFAAAAGQQQQVADVRFVIAYRSEVVAATRPLRLVWNGQPHDIVGAPIDVDGAREYLECMTIAGVRDGR